MKDATTGEEPLCYHAPPEVTAHALMNEATEWLQYASGLTSLLSDLVHESEEIDGKKLSLGLEGIAALMRMGVQCTAQAHVRMCWELVRETDTLRATEG